MGRCGFNGLRCRVTGRGPAESRTAGRATCPATLLSAYTTLFSICLAKGTFNAGLVLMRFTAVSSSPCVSSIHPSNSSGPNRSQGGISRTTRQTCGLGIRDIFPPNLLQAQQNSSAQRGHSHVVATARPGAGLVLIPAYVAPLRLELRFYTPPVVSYLRRGVLPTPGPPTGWYLPESWTGNSGLAAAQVPAVDSPVDFAGLTPAGWTHPQSPEQVAAGTLASLGPP